MLRGVENYLAKEREMPPSSEVSDPPEGSELDLAAVVRHIFEKINDTRRELEALTNMARERDSTSFNGVGDELEAITHDTEQATTNIMNRVDDIEDVVRAIRTNGIHQDDLDRILKSCSDITLACSFQDITGQRVQKVVEVIESIDGQLSKIETQLGGEGGYSPKAQKAYRKTQREKGLLNGPALPEEPVGQDEIDELFRTAEEAPFNPSAEEES
ncbi:Chemotaxis protein [Salipiger mucosus DSM 16094]|uniref:Chemotaxis protein n=2 Tax=Salipiger mucosus TaxID=263378 RepID=S9QWU8_9RHOB|nr:Chemotaxis protein [Salipiger mucosus DSM 16094]